MPTNNSVSVIIPTYNEIDNIESLLNLLGQSLDSWDYQLIVVDDNSSDGTSEIVQSLAQGDSRIAFLSRPAKLGLGSAIIDGLKVCTGHLVAMMDADMSHNPRELPKLLEAAHGMDLVIGSRYVRNASVTGRSLLRRTSTKLSIWISKICLGLKPSDTTSGFVVYDRNFIAEISPRLQNAGFKLLIEILALAPEARIKEIPIAFVERIMGKSKYSIKEILAFIRLCLRLRFQTMHLFSRG
jgi:dolichol-phosphate mannosyltransferase